MMVALLALVGWLVANIGVPDDPPDAQPSFGVQPVDVHLDVPALEVERSFAPPRPAREVEKPAAVSAPSLAGTEIDGAFTVEAGHFVADRQAIRLFDYFLSTEGERSSAAITDEVDRLARARLAPDDAERASALFDRYLRYRQTLSTEMERLAPGDVRGALALMRRLQSEFFGAADAERMFGREDALAERLLAAATQ